MKVFADIATPQKSPRADLDMVADAIERVAKAFANAWNQIHSPDAWDRDDWVWAITFKRVETSK